MRLLRHIAAILLADYSIRIQVIYIASTANALTDALSAPRRPCACL